MFFNSVDIGIDLGTANLLVYIKGKGIVFNEPSVVAINRSKNKILAVGNEARDMIGKVPESISVIRPLKEGVIANYTVTQKMLEFVVERVAGKSFFSKPRIMVCIPTGITSVEKRAVLEAAGIKDIRTKCLRSNNANNVVGAAFEGLKAMRSPEQVAKIRGKSVEEIVG